MAGASEILHCDDVISGDELPSKAIRRAKTTSMWGAVQAVKAGRAGAAVSAGNTGALMAFAMMSNISVVYIMSSKAKFYAEQTPCSLGAAAQAGSSTASPRKGKSARPSQAIKRRSIHSAHLA
jgi:hypothetical protein